MDVAYTMMMGARVLQSKKHIKKTLIYFETHYFPKLTFMIYCWNEKGEGDGSGLVKFIEGTGAWKNDQDDDR